VQGAREVKTPKRPRDTNQLAKLMVDILTGQVENGVLRLQRRRRQRVGETEITNRHYPTAAVLDKEISMC
jgi:hypothetical protein